MKSIDRLSLSLRIVLAHFSLISLAGFFVIGSLLSEPSQEGGFLGFSAGRWAVLLVNLLVLIGVLFALYKVWKNQARGMETWLSKEKHLFRVFFLSIFLFAFSFPAGLGSIPAIREFAYFGRIQPSLLWLAFTSGQVFLTLLIVLRKPILFWFRQFLPETSEQETPGLSVSQRYIMLAVMLAYLSLQAANHLKVREAIWLPDSIDYIFPAETFAWNELGLWTHTKPWGAAVFFKLTGTSPVMIDAAQTILSALAWLLLAWIFSRFIHGRWLKPIAFAFPLGFSLSPSVQMWNHIIQSEALSISLMVLILSVWLSLLQNWRWGKLIALVFFFSWWIGTRETNVYLGLMIAGILVLVGLAYKHQRFYWAVSVALFLFCYINLQISEIPTLPRWLYPLTNTLLNRIVPNEEYLSYFEGHGLPISPELMSLSGGMAKSGDFAVYNDPALNEVEFWLYRKGKNIYVQFLISHPVYTLTEPWIHIDEQLEPVSLTAYAPKTYRPVLGTLFGMLFYPNSLWLVLLLAILMLFFTVRSAAWRDSKPFWVLIFFLLLFLPHFYLVWHGDAAEVGRHAVQASVQLRLVLWLLLLLALDKIVTNGYAIRTRYRS